MTYEEAVAFMKKHRARIVEEARRPGVARDVVNLYSMHVDCPPDPGAQGLFLGAVEELKAQWDGEETPIPNTFW